MEGAKLLPATTLTLAAASISTSYALVGVMLQPARIIYFTNSTPDLLIFSLDGIHDHQYVLTNQTITIDAGAARGTPQTSSVPPYSLYVKSTATPGSGSAIVNYWYAD